jgi:hypothetical protein
VEIFKDFAKLTGMSLFLQLNGSSLQVNFNP